LALGVKLLCSVAKDKDELDALFRNVIISPR